MNDFLKGNFKTDKEVKDNEIKKEESIEDQFEKEALKHLGGSIAFVSKKKVMWNKKNKSDSDLSSDDAESKDLKVKK